MIVVVSNDKNFSHTLAEQIVRELGVPCECLESAAQIGQLRPDLVISADKSTKIKDIPLLILEPPIRLREALSSISAEIRKNEDSTATIGKNCVFSLRQKTISNGSNKATLTDKESSLVAAIMAAGSQGIEKDLLLKEIWGFEADLNTHTLETHIYRLRAKLKDVSGSEMIIAVGGRYKFDI